MEIEQMEMDEEFANSVYDVYEDDEFVFDFRYEFDAPRFFDFSRPERKWETIEADRWFETSTGYPPPPFLMKLKWANDTPVEKLESFGNSKGREGTFNSTNVRCSTKGMNMIKPHGKTRGNGSSTLMNPTASHLAKQRKPGEAHSRRSQDMDRSCFQQSATGSQSTKRQKLEASYICKGALKQENSFPHKLGKVKPFDVEVPTRTRVTIPKEPHLETANRAQRRNRLKVDLKTAEQEKSNGYIFKAQPLTRKEFRFKTSQRASNQTYSNMSSPKLNTKNVSDFSLQQRSEAKVLGRANSSESLKPDRGSTINKLKGGPLTKITNGKKLLKDLPTELFSMLSLDSEVHEVLKPQPNDPVPVEDMKENNPTSIHGGNKSW